MAIDAAIYISNKIIDIYNEGKKEYQVDFFKIHKLLYIAQGIMLSEYGYPLFKESIRAHKCGAYIEGLDNFYERVGTDNITEKISDKYSDIITELITPERKSVLDYVAHKYGRINRNDLISLTKKHSIYIEAFEKEKSNGPKPEMDKSALKSFFNDHKNTLYPYLRGA